MNHKWIFSYFVKLYTFVKYWKIDEKDIVDMSKFVKELVYCFFVQDNLKSNVQQNYRWLERDELDKKSFWRNKIIEKLLLTITIIDLQLLNWK